MSIEKLIIFNENVLLYLIKSTAGVMFGLIGLICHILHLVNVSPVFFF